MLSKLDELSVDSLAWAKKEANNQNRAIQLGTKYIDKPAKEGYTFTEVVLHDRQYSPKGWQFRRVGNSTKGRDMFESLRAGCEELEDLGRCARNDSDLRYYEKLILRDKEGSVVEVSTSPSRSGNSCTYSFFIVATV